MIIPCTRKSLVYENICGDCNKGAKGKDEVVGSNPDVPSIYVGETSRTIFERAKEHWGAALGSTAARAKSHIAKHQEMVHGGGEPNFTMRAVKFHRSALSRQTGEAIRIRRRGGEGAVLNSKGEFNRSFIPRLQLVEEDKIKEVEQAEMEDLRLTMVELDGMDGSWESSKANKRRTTIKNGGKPGSSGTTKRALGSKVGRPGKRLKYDVLPREWGSSDMVEHGGESTAKTTFQNGMQYHGGGERAITLVEKDDVPTPPPYKDGNGGGRVRGGWYQDHPVPPPHNSPNTMLGYCLDETLRSEVPTAIVGEPATVERCAGLGIPDTSGNDDTFGGGTTSGYQNKNTMVTDGGVMKNDYGDNGEHGEACGVDEVMNIAVTTAPSMPTYANEKAECNNDRMKSGGLFDVVRVNNSEDRKCIITNGICCNGCLTKTIQVSVKRRVQNKKTLLWSDRSRKITKPICVRGNSGRANLVNSGDRANGRNERGSENARP